MAEKGKSPENIVRDIKRRTRRVFNAEEKIRIVLEGLKGEESIYAFWVRIFLASKFHAGLRSRLGVTTHHKSGGRHGTFQFKRSEKVSRG